MEQVPNIVRERLKGAAGGDHPDPDLLSAFAEQVLPGPERARVLLHLSACTECRDVLALALPPAESPSLTLDTGQAAPWFRWPILRWGAVAACVVVVGSAVLMKRDVFTARAPQSANVDRDADASGYLKHEQAAEATANSSPTMRRQADGLQESSVDRLTGPARAKKQESGGQQDKSNARFESEQTTRAPVAQPSPQSIPSRGSSAGSFEKAPAQYDRGFALAGNARTAPESLGAGARADQAFKIAPQEKDEEKRLQPEAGRVTDLAKASKPDKSAEAHAAPSFDDYALATDSGEKREAPGKAKAASSNAVLDAGVAATPAAAPAIVPEAVANERGTRAKAAFSRPSPLSRWTISSDGQLQHSVDSGISWQPVVVAEKASFRALSSNGPDIWVGGTSGLLYHSTDAGVHWNQIKPSSPDATLTADIAAIEFTDLRHGKITTATGESWLTEDAGQSWRKQP
jgi:photosynthesis system II assembly factor YCF48-like protein/putative zinc finger protein